MTQASAKIHDPSINEKKFTYETDKSLTLAKLYDDARAAAAAADKKDKKI